MVALVVTRVTFVKGRERKDLLGISDWPPGGQLSLTLPFAFFDGIPETLKHTDPAHFAEIKNTTVPKY